MNESLNVRLGNPRVMFFWASAMFLAGVLVGAYWHPSRAISAMVAVGAGVFTMVQELASCFVWCSLTAWWIGWRSEALQSKR